MKRQPLTIDCNGLQLAAMLHPASGETGVLIVTGGVQSRIGSHRGFVSMADRLQAAGHPVLRFDRRGIGDSDGTDPGFRNSEADIVAAAAAFRQSCPSVRRIYGWGLCDGASALALFGPVAGLDGLILCNPWLQDVDHSINLPPPAAIAARYGQRLRDPRAWMRLISGGVDLGKLLRGLTRLWQGAAPTQLAQTMADSLKRYAGAKHAIVAGDDATGQVFAEALRKGPLRACGITLHRTAAAGHSFAGHAAQDWLTGQCLTILGAYQGAVDTSSPPPPSAA